MIWQDCRGEQHISPLSGTLYRLVESQEQVATSEYVDNLDEQALLEGLLEEVKPPAPTGNYHYLLKTPFRYPPLPWGSRFGSRHQPGIFYGGKSIRTTLAEVAFYRLVFFESMGSGAPKSSINTQHTLFSADYRSDCGICLQNAPFDRYQAQISDPLDYTHSKQLGSDMRSAGVQVFEYSSARDPDGGLCVALFSPSAFDSRTPHNKHAWLCEVSSQAVRFKALGERQTTLYRRAKFCINEQLPVPAV